MAGLVRLGLAGAVSPVRRRAVMMGRAGGFGATTLARAQSAPAIHEIIGAIKGEKEVRFWQKHYEGRSALAVVKVDGEVLMDPEMADELAKGLAAIQRMGLRPVVINSAGPQLTALLRKRGLEPNWQEGERVTCPTVLRVLRTVFAQETRNLVRMVKAHGAPARALISSQVFQATQQPQYGMFGDVTRVHLEQVHDCLEAGDIPVLCPIGETMGGQIVNINSDKATRMLAKSLGPLKCVFVASRGGVFDWQGKLISRITADSHFEHLQQQSWLAECDGMRLRQVRKLLHDLPLQSTVSITGPSGLPAELLSHVGTGTSCRREVPISKVDALADVDSTRLLRLINCTFGRAVQQHWVQHLEKTLTSIYVTEDYTGTAIITDLGVYGMAYLDKFAVTDEAKGVGTASRLWNLVTEAHPDMFWRSRTNNPINSWYFAKCDGAVKAGEWTVFWIGNCPAYRIEHLVNQVLSLPGSFHSPKFLNAPKANTGMRRSMEEPDHLLFSE